MFWIFMLVLSLWVLYGSLKYSVNPKNKIEISPKVLSAYIVTVFLPFLNLYGLLSTFGQNWPSELKIATIIIVIFVYVTVVGFAYKLGRNRAEGQ